MPLTIDIELRNYRCFEDSAPARFTLKPGFTALIGKNNSGKSTLLRFLFEFRDLFQVLQDPPSFGNAMLSNQAFGYPPTVPNPEPLFCDTNQRGISIGLRISDPSQPQDRIPQLVEVTVERDTTNYRVRVVAPDGAAVDATRGVDVSGVDLLVGGSGIASLELLRSVFKLLSNTLYIGAFRNAINVGSLDQFYDMQVGEAFIKQWKQLQTGGIKSSGEATYRLTEEIRRIFEFRQLQINASADDKTLRLFVNERQYGLLEMGSGLSQFILVLANAAIRKPSYILIDEPELNLHSSLQTDFLETLTAYSSEGVVFATHSLGLARVAADSIYSVVRNGTRSEVHPFD